MILVTSALIQLECGSLWAQFVAFNDHAPGPGTSTNATTWNIFGNSPGTNGLLKDIATGTSLPVMVTITRAGTVSASPTGANPNAGTPLYNAFNGYVDFQGGTNSDAVAQVVGTATVTYTFTNLNPSRIYSFRGSAVRGGSGGTYPQRWSLFQLDGARTFVSVHTAGAYTNGLSYNQVAINTGVNLAGDMADWENIVPATNGTFAVTTTQYTGTIPGGGTANGPYCYALTGFRLEELLTASPTIASVANMGNNALDVVFSIPVQTASATNAGNYSLTNTAGVVTILGAAFGQDSRTIHLTTSSQSPYSTHWLTIHGVADALTGTNVIAPNSQGVFTNIAFTTGYIKRQLYFNLGNANAITGLTANVKFPNSPDQVDYPPSMGWPRENIADGYGGRFSGILVAPVSGQYSFAVRSDDSSQLYFSTNESSVSKTLITQETGCCNSFDAHTNGPITLAAGQRCYIEALMKEGGGGDYLYVAWKTPTNNAVWNVVPGTFLGGYTTASNSTLTLLQSPSNTTVMAGQTAAFSAFATGSSSITTNVSYQWQLNGTDIPAAFAPTYITPVVRETNSGAVYRVLVSIPGTAIFTTNAFLTVVPDTVPPTVAHAFNLGTTNVQLNFSEPVEAATAINPSNYTFSNSVAVIGAVIDSTFRIVTLTTTPLVIGSNYTMKINGVRDQATTPNTIATNTLVGFTALPYAEADIGGGAFATVTTFLTNGLIMRAAGADVGGYSDQFGFNYQLRFGDFDVAARVTSVELSDVWAKAGLMARETLDPGSRFAASMATPSVSGTFFEYRDPVSGPSLAAGAFPVNYPNTWLRLQRSGNLFTGFSSYDGITWTVLSSATISMPSQVYLGFCVSSRSSGLPATAQFRDVVNAVTNGIVGTVLNPHETLGPSSRKTGLVISEIMYKPAARTDGRNLEYLELFNSTPFFQDVGGYKLAGGSLNYTFPPGTILPGGAFIVLAASPTDIQFIYGTTNIAGPYVGSLKKSDIIQLIDEQGSVLLTVPYSNLAPWPTAADGTGHSIVLANPTYGEEDPRAWDISETVGGSPGVMESFHPNPLRNVVINEWLAHSETPALRQFIELYNHGNLTNDLSGCILTDDPATNRFVIAPGTLIPPHGFVSFDQTQLGFLLNGGGGAIFLIQADRSRILDSVQFEAQADGISFGRWPDGADVFYPLAARTPATNNAAPLIRDVVINELMYKPISGNDDDQYIELYNKGTNAISLANWRFTAGVTFVFPPGASLAPDGYLVVARNTTNLFARYPNLNSGNTFGNFSGKLSHNGERLALAMPQPFFGTNTIFVVADEVTYGAGGRWGQWAGGGGSSLELIDPHANRRLAANWADSDETHKSSWINVEATGVLDNGKNYDAFIDYAQIGILDVGECLVDNLEVRASGGTNLVINPDFEAGLTNWSLQGCHVRSSLEGEGYASSQSLHIRSSDRLWTGDNSCELALFTNSLAAGQTATLRFKARWLRGWPEVLMRLNGNWLEATAALPVPANLGTPGARNSRFITNAGPALFEVTHAPAVPPSNQPVVVTARVHDPDGVQSLLLNYRIDPSSTYSTLSMKDDGSGGDLVAGDGIFSATIPGQTAGTIVAFYLTASDALSSATRFPALLNDQAPVRECVIMFGDANPFGCFGAYHLWITQTNATRWSNLSDLSNESHDGTIVNGSRVIYNAQARFAGSPYHQGFNTPYGNLCHYKWIFPEDDKFLGATSFNKIHQPGNGAGDDASIQREQAAHTFLRQLGVPWLYKRYVAVFVNGNRRGSLMEDTQVPDGDMVKERFPNDSRGFLFKMQPWFEFGPAPVGQSIAFQNESWCNLMPYTTTGGVKKVARYRYNYLSRRTPDSASNYTNVFSLIDAANSAGTANYVANMENMADMENWMRVFAANHAAGNWDSFGAQNAQNLYGYIGTLGTRYTLLMWDFNIVLGNSGSWGPGQNLFTVNGQDPNMASIYANPTFRRMYWRALLELVSGPLNVAGSGLLLDAKYNAFTASGLTVEPPDNIKSWLTQAQSSIAAQAVVENAAGFVVDPTVIVTNDVAVVTGTAPFLIKSVLLNGISWPLTWTTATNWMVNVPLRQGSNFFNILGVDIHSQPVAGASGSVGVISGTPLPSPVGQVVLNEIQANPAVPGGEYLELYNNSTNITFDLSGWQLQAVSYTFPAGSVIQPNQFLVLAANRAAFAGAYGATIPIFDTFAGTLQPAGQLLELVIPGIGPTPAQIVAGVRFAASAPWPSAASGTGSSLQLIDPVQDNWRVGNWSSSFPPILRSPGATNTVQTNLPVFPTLWINELEAANLTGITNSAGQRTPWIEIFNPSSNVVSLAGLYLGNTYINPTNWVFPAGSVVNPGQFKIIFADGQTNLSTLAELHASFTLSNSSGSVILSRIYNGQPQLLDYVDYTGLTPNRSFGSFPDGQAFDRREFVYVTPGGTNNGTEAPITVSINEWMAANTHTIPDPLDGNKFDDWFELYNAGTNTVNLAGYYLTDTLTNLVKFQIPTGYQIPGKGFLLVWADKKTPTGSGDLHVNFKLSKSGTSIGLYSPDGNPVDFVSFGLQTSDISEGRFPDGSASLIFMPTATPRTNNIAPNTPPALSPIANVVATLGQTVLLTANAADSDLPAQTLAFSLANGSPPGAAINSGNGLFSWTPPSAPATNLVTVVVSDNGIPSLSATQSFSVVVVPPPALSASFASGSQLILNWPSSAGQHYQVEYKASLTNVNWTSLNIPLTGVWGLLSFTNDTSGSPQGFFRMRITP